jgi:hypothetical protein
VPRFPDRDLCKTRIFSLVGGSQCCAAQGGRGRLPPASRVPSPGCSGVAGRVAVMRLADDPLADVNVAVALARLHSCRHAAALFVAVERHLLRPGARIRRDVGHEALGADPRADLEVRRGQDAPFFLRPRVPEERLVPLFELERELAVFLPLARAEPRFEPRFVWRLLRFAPPAVWPPPPPPEFAPCPAVPSPA